MIKKIDKINIYKLCNFHTIYKIYLNCSLLKVAVVFLMKKFSLVLLSTLMMVAMTHTQAAEAFDSNGQYQLGDGNGKGTELAV